VARVYHYFLFDKQWVRTYLWASADLKRTACGRLINAAKAVGARPRRKKADGRAYVCPPPSISGPGSTAQRGGSLVARVTKSILSRQFRFWRPCSHPRSWSACCLTASFGADKPKTINIDWATYNPVSMLLKEKGLLEKEFAKDGIGIRWVQTLGSNKGAGIPQCRFDRLRLDRRLGGAGRQDQRQSDQVDLCLFAAGVDGARHRQGFADRQDRGPQGQARRGDPRHRPAQSSWCARCSA